MIVTTKSRRDSRGDKSVSHKTPTRPDPTHNYLRREANSRSEWRTKDDYVPFPPFSNPTRATRTVEIGC